MQSAVIQQLAVALQQVEQTARPKHIDVDELSDSVNALYQLIADRAFEIFQCRGGADGHDVDDWLRAEGELFHNTHLDVEECDDSVAVRAEVPGFHAYELLVSLEPRQLTITGKRTSREYQGSRRTVYRDSCADRVFRVLRLPAEVDPKKATATLEDGILELAMPKTALSPKMSVETKTDWIVRVADYRAWRVSTSWLDGHG